MISASVYDRFRAVKLLQEDDAEELVRQGDISKGDNLVRAGFDGGGNAVASADDEGQFAIPFEGAFVKQGSDGFAGDFFAFDVGQNHFAFELCENGFALRFALLGGVRHVRRFGDLDDLRFCPFSEAFDIFRNCLAIEAFLDVAHGDNAQFQHMLIIKRGGQKVKPKCDSANFAVKFEI